MSTHYLALDLGAESGRLMLGTLSGERLSLDEIHRFSNEPFTADGELQWNIPHLEAELKNGLIKAAGLKLPIASISVDSWGVDYLLFDDRNAVIHPTFHYRDPRTARGIKRAQARVDWPTTFSETGIQFMPINTIYQLMAEHGGRLENTRRLLGVGDAFNHLLGGEPCMDRSLASTTQLYNPRTGDWSWWLIDQLGLPRHIFPTIVPSGTIIGKLSPELVQGSGLPEIEVIATCSHDTGAAVAAVPAAGNSWAYLSSGTWSLMGVECPEPIINETAREYNFTNEAGYGGTTRLLKNIIGLWLIQECRRDWAAGGREFDYATLTELAGNSQPFVSLIDPTDPRFLAPDDMPLKIAAFCVETGQPAPSTPGAIVRCALESLALLYRRTMAQLEALTGHQISRLHIVGGGSKNELLNQFAANALQIPVFTGPAEATAAGNVMIQAVTLGHIATLSDGREIIRNSFNTKEFHPHTDAAWPLAFEQFQDLIERPKS